MKKSVDNMLHALNFSVSSGINRQGRKEREDRKVIAWPFLCGLCGLILFSVAAFAESFFRHFFLPSALPAAMSGMI
jgi:hypothetical protein